MKVPVVVQMARKISTIIATDGPDSHSHRDRPRTSAWAQPGLSMPNAPNARWNRPRGSENHAGPWIPNSPRKALTAPEFPKRNKKTVVMAIELVTDGK
ncbi:hypothetical protein GCM10025862_15340 [Arsenicicoccus piscis]|uniref:Uncharacterized protein n=1 Tax=Arsenicicoccus piscis TaxID=673954 RepID=A0ABQ6HM25_9MICO|nr:hypothetical protein GCM10025862_15340 [Arsenicicoccus piscis]